MREGKDIGWAIKEVKEIEVQKIKEINHYWNLMKKTNEPHPLKPLALIDQKRALQILINVVECYLKTNKGGNRL